jgi:hypothetical protein
MRTLRLSNAHGGLAALKVYYKRPFDFKLR